MTLVESVAVLGCHVYGIRSAAKFTYLPSMISFLNLGDTVSTKGRDSAEKPYIVLTYVPEGMPPAWPMGAWPCFGV